MEALKAEVKKQLQKYIWKDSRYGGYLVRKDPKPFANLTGRQRKKAIKEARRIAKAIKVEESA